MLRNLKLDPFPQNLTILNAVDVNLNMASNNLQYDMQEAWGNSLSETPLPLGLGMID